MEPDLSCQAEFENPLIETGETCLEKQSDRRRRRGELLRAGGLWQCAALEATMSPALQYLVRVAELVSWVRTTLPSACTRIIDAFATDVQFQAAWTSPHTWRANC